MAITFFPASSLAEQFTFVFLPDTQNYLERDTTGGTPVSANPAIFEAQTQWIANNAATENIVYVGHLGDIVNGVCDSDTLEWGHADTAMELLDGAGITYGVLPGNHDWNPPGTGSGCLSTSTRGRYNGTDSGYGNLGFGPGRFSGLGSNYGNQDGTNDNNYVLFQSGGGIEFIAINLAYSNTDDATVLNWMEDRLREHADRKAIITSHYILGDDDANTGVCDSGPGDYGDAIIDRIANHPNVFLLLSAHCLGEKWVTYDNTSVERACMGDVNAMLSNYQNYVNISPNEDSGYLRILRIDTNSTSNNVAVETFSPWIAGFSGTGGVPAHPGSLPASGDNSTAAGMDGDSRSNFSFSYDFNKTLAPSIMLLLDSSGSMSWDVEGVAGVPAADQRITFARESAKAFLDLLESALENPARINVGIAGFPDHTPLSNASTDSAEILMPLTALDSAGRSQADTVLDNIDPNGGTPMLTGIGAAATELEPQICKPMLLLSDGYHNVPGTVSSGDPVVTGLIDDLDATSANPVPIYAVSFGKKGTNDYQVLQDLATGTGGEFFDATTAAFDPATWDPATQLQSTFKNIIQNAFQSDIETGVDPLDRISFAETKSFEIPINEHDTRATFYLSWRKLQQRLLSLTLYDSTGKPVPVKGKGIKVKYGNSYTILTLDKSALRAVPGRIGPAPWRIEVGSGRLDNGQSEPFQYSVLLNSGLKLAADIGRQSYAAGDEITLSAKLTQGQRPLTGLTNVEVVISAPDDGKGNWLSQNPVSVQQLARVPVAKGGEVRADFVRKAIYLSDIAGIAYPAQLGPRTIRLFDDGSHGDVLADDGIYTNRFAGTDKEGIYSFHFRASGPTLGENSFKREQMLQRYLSIRADADFIAVVATLISTTADTRIYDIRFTPMDALGNFVGPGHSGLIRTEATNARFSGELRDLLDGSYSRTLEVAVGTATGDVDISISVGETIKPTSLDGALGGTASKLSISYYLGKTFPHGNFNRDYDGDLSLGIGLELAWKPQLSAVVELQSNRFDADRGSLSDTDWTSLTGGIKYFVSTGATQPYLGAGAGFYSPKSGSTEPGIYVGAGITHAFNSRWSASLGAQHHRLSTSGGDTEYSLLRAGLNYRW
jgi:Mg-chelatase subunit ChlD